MQYMPNNVGLNFLIIMFPTHHAPTCHELFRAKLPLLFVSLFFERVPRPRASNPLVGMVFRTGNPKMQSKDIYDPVFAFFLIG
jgi:hypothetical protein